VDIKNTLKTSVATAALMAVAVPVSADPLDATTGISSGNGNTLKISGHVNRAMVYNDNGGGSTLAHIDHSASQTRFRLVASGVINDDWTVGARIEVDPNSNTQQSATQTADGTYSGGNNYAHGDSIGVRHADVSFTHKTMGKFTMGHTSQASDGVADSNQSGASTVVNVNSLGHGNINFWNNTNQNTSNWTPGSFSIQGGRHEVVRYDSPTILSGLKISASHGNEGNTDFAGYYGGTFGAFSVKAAMGYGNYSGSAADRHFGSGSLSIKHESGISVQGAAAWADKDSTDDDASMWWFGAGYDVAVYEMGTTSFAIGYGESNDETAVDAEVDKFEIGVSQAISSAGTTLYAGWRTWDFAIETQTNGQNDSFDDIMSFVAGAKVTF